MRSNWLSIPIMAISLVLSSCGQNELPETAGHNWGFANPENGIEVGNGVIQNRYVSPYKFSVKYRSELTLKKGVEEKEVEFDNSSLVKGDEKTSAIKFTVKIAGKDYEKFSDSKNLKDHLEGLKRSAEKSNPKAKWEAVHFPGASGFGWNVYEGSKQSAGYSIL